MNADQSQPLALPVRAKAAARISFIEIIKDQGSSRRASIPAEGLPVRNCSANVFTTKFAGPIQRPIHRFRTRKVRTTNLPQIEALSDCVFLLFLAFLATPVFGLGFVEELLVADD